MLWQRCTSTAVVHTTEERIPASKTCKSLYITFSLKSLSNSEAVFTLVKQKRIFVHTTEERIPASITCKSLYITCSLKSLSNSEAVFTLVKQKRLLINKIYATCDKNNGFFHLNIRVRLDIESMTSRYRERRAHLFNPVYIICVVKNV
jgi:hypothetical protein